ncbi:unnamed protein product [Bursaphelenchus okinawaensis]|uniref:Phosphoinositide phospholipase C n=1 Tax=Bursaphelenchus okinawaensis TaxID=465554 RepID=A0A811KVJ9_9BILA|nr:unnamed protein product [Bursaphelenchus okinawaensis]CAG9112070.1 unnamed protein product [Bursaphelenchus okinawaensis]
MTETRKKSSVLEMEKLTQILEEGIPVRRIKNNKVDGITVLAVEGAALLKYKAFNSIVNRIRFKCAPKQKLVDVDNVIEVREGYNSDGLHAASKHFKFQQRCPESNCFSIIYKHPKFVCKSIDFACDHGESRTLWVNSFRTFLVRRPRDAVTFDEKLWLSRNFKEADLNKNGEIAFSELWKLLKQLNLQMSEQYVKALFKQVLETKQKHNKALDETEFFELFRILTDLPEYRNALRQANPDGEESLHAKQLAEFLKTEQNFDDVDESKALDIIKKYEVIEDTEEKDIKLTINGFRRLLQSRYGFIMKPNHETVFQDMDQPLSHYFVNSSHNTYLTGLQVRGNATVEGYISALKNGARLLELDIFDGEHGEPQITHKRTLIAAISLRNVVKCIAQYAFESNPYPVILTLENHAGHAQQKVMADIFEEILGDKLYIPPEDAATKPLPSPDKLKNKILLRGKTIQTPVSTPEDEEAETPEEQKLPRSPIHPSIGRLIALPSVKLTTNIYADVQDHPLNGSPSLSESKVLTLLEAGAPLGTYTAKRFVKSYPKGIRQDSSNMHPVASWICGIQSVAMNLQTTGEEMDLVSGMFSINGKTGYVLKPSLLLDGLDPRIECQSRSYTVIRVGVICAQYLPKAEPGHDIVDPYVSLEVFGIPGDEYKAKTKAIRNNGFNPVWNEDFTFKIKCPELAMIKFTVKDFDSTSSNDFVGVYSLPVSSIRPGYSHIRLNTGFEHSPDDAASIFVRIEFDKD